MSICSIFYTKNVTTTMLQYSGKYSRSQELTLSDITTLETSIQQARMSDRRLNIQLAPSSVTATSIMVQTINQHKK